ncbi:zinc finger BED domain-containing protein 4 [Trichomycterus rosablanca]|uniref:zinc finger BED domain-containing protein 4 n=1 Tax=Trichomycterus rosablanca TaxID=2290929 RepID=UPI002F3534DF
MASHSRVSILDYFNIVFEGENGKIESNCKACGTRIQAKRTVTSNFVTHLKRKHQAMYNEFVRKKDIKREAYSSGGIQTYTSLSGSGTSRTPPQSGVATPKFDRSDPRQSLISEAIAKMIICDLQPVQMVENEGFRELLQLLEPRYVPEPSHYIQRQLLPAYVYQVQLALKRALSGSESCSVTLDLCMSISNKNRSGYMGVTCHFLTSDWQIKSALLSCLPLPNHRDTNYMLADFDKICHGHGISGKVFRIVVDPFACKTRSAFQLPGFCLDGNSDVDDEDEDSSDKETDTGVVKQSGAEDQNSLNQWLDWCRIDCFAHSLGQCIREGIFSSSQISKTINKAACFYNHVITAVAPEKLSQVFGYGMTGKEQFSLASDRHWNTQLKTLRLMLECVDFLEDIVAGNDLALNTVEKTMLRELVEVLEPFEEATDMIQGDKHVSISIALPSVLGLRKHLAEVVTHQCTGLVTGLTQALDRRLAGILEDPLYVVATTLDPQFKLSWSSDRDWHKQVFLEEVAKHAQPVSPPEPSSEAQPVPSKRSRLFSFIKERPTMQAKSVEQELAAYLHEEPTDEDPLQYWKRKSIDFPLLSQVAKKVLTVPATTTAVEKIFNILSKIMRQEGCGLLPKNLDTLIYLKGNHSIIWP